MECRDAARQMTASVPLVGNLPPRAVCNAACSRSEFYNPYWLLLLRLSVLEIRRGAVICFAAIVCNDLGERDVVALKVVSLNLGYRRPPGQGAFLSTAGIVVDNYSGR